MTYCDILAGLGVRTLSIASGETIGRFLQYYLFRAPLEEDSNIVTWSCYIRVVNAKFTSEVPGRTCCVRHQGLSRMRGNSQVRFLAGLPERNDPGLLYLLTRMIFQHITATRKHRYHHFTRRKNWI